MNLGDALMKSGNDLDSVNWLPADKKIIEKLKNSFSG